MGIAILASRTRGMQRLGFACSELCAASASLFLKDLLKEGSLAYCKKKHLFKMGDGV